MARLPDGWVLTPRIEGPKKEDGQLVVTVSVEEKELVMCKHCRYRWTSMCTLYKGGQETADDWYCADGEEDSNGEND